MEAFPQSLDINLTPEQLEQMYKNMCNYFGVDYNEPKELEGVKQIVKEQLHIGSTDLETINRLNEQKETN